MTGRKFGVFSHYRRLFACGHDMSRRQQGLAAIVMIASVTVTAQRLRTYAWRAAALAAAALLSACTLPDDQALKMVNRGKYSLYDCHAIGRQVRESALRERELAGAIEKASRGPGGGAHHRDRLPAGIPDREGRAAGARIDGQSEELSQCAADAKRRGHSIS